MTGKELAEKYIDMAKNYKTTYVWGAVGVPITEANIQTMVKQYSKNATKGYADNARKLIGQKNAFMGDCVCSIKALLWGWCGDSTKFYGGAKYASNGVPDVSADGMIALCKDVSTNFDESTMSIGEALWTDGHIGVYIGNGLDIECTPAFNNGVQITAIGNIGEKQGYYTRTWKKHGKMPWITYDDKEADTTVKVTYKAYKGGYLYEIPLESIERIEYFKSNGTSGETVSNAAKRIQWNGRYPDIICNAELFNMKTYAPASAVVDEGKAQLLNGTSGFGFIDHKTPKFSYNNNINAVDFIGGYPVLVHNGAKAFTTDPAGLSGNRARTALGLNATNFSIAVVPESSNDATLSDMANLFIQNGYADAIGLDGGGSTAYQTNEFSYEQGRKVRGFICVWYKGGKGNKASQSYSPSVNPKPVTPTQNPPLKQDTSAKYGIKYTVKANGGLNIRDAQGTIITLLSNGSTVMWYGYYTEQYSMDGKWLYVKTSNGVTGYVSSKYLVR